MGRYSDQELLDMILTQSMPDTDDPLITDPEPTALSPIPEASEAPKLNLGDGTVDGSAPNGLEDVADILKEAASTEENQAKRKAENKIDNEVPDSKPSKKRKTGTSDSVTSRKKKPQSLEGKLVRPTLPRVARDDNQSKGEDIFDVPTDFPKLANTLERVNSSQKENAKIGPSPEPLPSIHSKNKLAPLTPKKKPGKGGRGRPPGTSKQQENPVDEGSGHTLENQEVDGFTSLSATHATRQPRSPTTENAKVAPVNVNSQIRDGEVNEQPNVQKEGSVDESDKDPSGNEDLPANTNLEPGTVPQQDPQRMPLPQETKRPILPAFNDNPETGEGGEGELRNTEWQANDNEPHSRYQESFTDGKSKFREPGLVLSHHPRRKPPPRKAKTPTIPFNPAVEDEEVVKKPSIDQKTIDENHSSREQDLPANGALNYEDNQSNPSQALATFHQDDAKQSRTKYNPEGEHVSKTTEDSAGISSKESSPENCTESTESDLESNLQDFGVVLFGREKGWKKILAAAKRTMDASKTIGGGKKEKLRIKSQHIKDLIELTEECIQSYEFLASEAIVSVESMDQHRRRIRRIRKKIDDLPWGSILEKRKEIGEERRLVRDIYAFGVPKMVTLLQKALETQSPLIAREDDVTVLKEIISIQHALHALCKRAQDSKVKPKTGRPIIQPTRTIKSQIETLRDVFMAELTKRKGRIEKKERDLKRLQEEQKEKHAQQEQAKVRKMERDGRDRREWEEISQKCAGLPGFAKFASRPQNKEGPNYRRPEAPVVNQWTTEQDSQLLMALLDEEHGELPAEERYLRALNASSLKNKLPVHIKERSLGFKEAIEKVWRDQGRPIPQWFLDME